MLISVVVEKACNKIQYPSIIKKIYNKPETESRFLKLFIKAIYGKPTGNITIANDRNLCSKIRNKTRISAVSAFIQNFFEGSSQRNYLRKINKSHLG